MRQSRSRADFTEHQVLMVLWTKEVW